MWSLLVDRFWLNVDLVFFGLDSPVCSPFIDSSHSFPDLGTVFLHTFPLFLCL